MAEGASGRPGASGLHPEPDQQDPRRPVQPPPGAPVSIPITWDELTEPDLRAAHWDLHAALDRVRTTGDPLVPLIRRQQTLRPL